MHGFVQQFVNMFKPTVKLDTSSWQSVVTELLLEFRNCSLWLGLLALEVAA